MLRKIGIIFCSYAACFMLLRNYFKYDFPLGQVSLDMNGRQTEVIFSIISSIFLHFNHRMFILALVYCIYGE